MKTPCPSLFDVFIKLSLAFVKNLAMQLYLIVHMWIYCKVIAQAAAKVNHNT